MNDALLTGLMSGVVVWLACAFGGRVLLRLAGVQVFSLFGGAFVFGYAMFAAVLLLFLRLVGDRVPTAFVLVGCAVLTSVAAWSFGRRVSAIAPAGRLRSASSRFKEWAGGLSVADVATCCVVVSWVGCVALVYLPVARFGGAPPYFFPDIFDLPKQLMAQSAAYHGTQWPVSNPFYDGEPFAYNLLFYLPPAAAAKLAMNELANFPAFAVATVAVALALPMTLIDIVRTVSRRSWAPAVAALLATWVGGLTPLIVKGTPAIGFALFTEKFIQDSIWVDEPFLSAIFVPQHIFAVLCALVSTVAITSVRDIGSDWRCILVAFSATAAGALASLILLPLLVAALGLNMLLLLHVQWRRDGGRLWPQGWPFKSVAAAVVPMAALAPFVLEARAWSSDVGSMLVMPRHPGQWLYALAAFGIVLPLSAVSLVRFGRQSEPRNLDPVAWRMIAIFLLVLTGAGAYLFGGYPDAGIKSGMWLRIVLVITATCGLEVIYTSLASVAMRRVAAAGVALCFAGLAAINVPATWYYLQSAARPLDPGVKALIADIRELPATARLVIMPSNQVLAAMIGRQVDFDALKLREDGYLPPVSRIKVKAFWTGIETDDASAWQTLSDRYDYAVVQQGSVQDKHFAAQGPPLIRYGSFSMYRLGRP